MSLVFGVIGTLILGTGMSIIMSELGAMLGLEGLTALALGVTLGLVGGVLAGLAYPAYCFVLRWRRKRVAPQIIRLTDELMK